MTAVSDNKNTLTAIKVPDTVKIAGKTYQVTAIGNGTYQGFKKASKVTIGKNIKSIGKNAFAKCSKLKTLTIPTSVTAINASSFQDCSALTDLTIGKNVTTIGKKAFYGCKKLKKVTINSSKLKEAKVGAKAFGGTPSKTVVKVPQSVKKAYKRFLLKKGILKEHSHQIM